MYTKDSKNIKSNNNMRQVIRQESHTHLKSGEDNSKLSNI